MLLIKRNWIRIYLYRFKVIPLIREGNWGDYHIIVWMWFYVVIGRKLNELESTVQRHKYGIEVDRAA